MTTTVLTDEQVGDLCQDWHLFFKNHPGGAANCIRAIEQAVLQSEQVQAWKCDAELYRALRQMHWNSSPLCVVENPKASVKLGSDCPSGERLDVAIRAAMEKQP